VALVVTVLLASASALAQSEKKAKPETKRVQAVSEWAYKRLNASHDAIADGNYAIALQKLDELAGKARLNQHEQALVWQTYGYVYGMQEKYKEATEAFEKCLAADALPEAAQLNVQFNVAQLYVVLERFPEAVKVFQEWFGKTTDPSPGAHYIYAIALFQSGDERGALEHGLAAVRKAPVPKEAWLQLVLAVYLKGKHYEDSVGILETLVGLHPRKAYWLQLSAVYAETGNYEKALSAMALAYEQGLLTNEREITHLAQLYLYNRIPYQATQVLEKGLAEGRIQGTVESWQLLADAWLAARERAKARKPLEQAASRATNGDLYLRLARVQIEGDEWSAARKSLTRAIEKGGLADPGDAHLLLGIASARDASWPEARRAFQVAGGYEKTEKAAKEWLLEVEAELAAEGESVQPPTGRTNDVGVPPAETAEVGEMTGAQ
jgi:tetratricopeptide (TPR) repeat protein